MTGVPSAADAAAPVLAGELLAGWARRAPHKPAVREDGRTLTWAELDAQVTALVSGITAAGVADVADVAVVDALPPGVTGKVLKPTIIAEPAEHPERLPWHRTASGAVGTR